MVTFTVDDDDEFEDEDDDDDNRHSKFRSERFTDHVNNEDELQQRQNNNTNPSSVHNNNNNQTKSSDRGKNNCRGKRGNWQKSHQNANQFSFFNHPFGPRAVNIFSRNQPFNNLPSPLSSFQAQSRLPTIARLSHFHPNFNYGSHVTDGPVPGLASLPSTSTMPSNPMFFGSPHQDHHSYHNVFGDQDIQILDNQQLSNLDKYSSLKPVHQKYLRPAVQNSTSLSFPTPYNVRSDSQFVNGLNRAVFGNRPTLSAPFQPLVSSGPPFQLANQSIKVPPQFLTPLKSEPSNFPLHSGSPSLQRHQIPVDAYKNRELKEKWSKQLTKPTNDPSSVISKLIHSHQSSSDDIVSVTTKPKNTQPRTVSDNQSVFSNLRPLNKFANQRFKYDARNNRQVIATPFKYKSVNLPANYKNFTRQKTQLPVKNDRVVKQVELVDLESSRSVVETTSDASDIQVIARVDKAKEVSAPMLVDLEIDEEYKRKLEEQKKLRESIIKRKEERRRELIMAKLQKKNTTIEQVPGTSSSSFGENNVSQPSIKNISQESSDNGLEVNSTSEKTSVHITGLANTTTADIISKLCKTVGPISRCVVEQCDSQKKAIVTFESSKDAQAFQTKYQRHLLDLCVIRVTLI